MYRIKDRTASTLKQEFSTLKRRLLNIWTLSYYVGTAGEISSETIKRYIEVQKGK
jgi:putative transposase